MVVPRVGAWIETVRPGKRKDQASRWSYPVWVRGLKQPAPIACTRPAGVVPRVGAWIET